MVTAAVQVDNRDVYSYVMGDKTDRVTLRFINTPVNVAQTQQDKHSEVT